MIIWSCSDLVLLKAEWIHLYNYICIEIMEKMLWQSIDLNISFCFSVDSRTLLPNKHGGGRREECNPSHQARQPGQSVRVQPVLTPRGDHPGHDETQGLVCHLSINIQTFSICGRFKSTTDCISLKPASQCYNTAIVSRCELLRL